MTKRQLSPRGRKILIAVAAVDGALKTAALLDLRRRPADQIRGSKRAWAAAITLINSVGVVPIGYFVYGRRPASHSG